MEIIYTLPEYEKNEIANHLGIDPFYEESGEYKISKTEVDNLAATGFILEDSCQILYNESLEERYLKDYMLNQFGELVHKKQLRVYRRLNEEFDPLVSDFTILGFRKRAPHYDRGRKTRAEYHCANNDDLIVQKIFNDVRDEATGRLTQLQVEFLWYCEDGSVGLTKTEIVKELNKAQAETIERQRRERSIDFLISEARGNTVMEPAINMLMLYFETQINRYKSKSADNFSEALKLEYDPNYNTGDVEHDTAYHTIYSPTGVLAARVPFTSDHSYTVPVKESILYQIGDLDEAGLLATLLPA